jgi:hypothetical protein
MAGNQREHVGPLRIEGKSLETLVCRIFTGKADGRRSFALLPKRELPGWFIGAGGRPTTDTGAAPTSAPYLLAISANLGAAASTIFSVISFSFSAK